MSETNADYGRDHWLVSCPGGNSNIQSSSQHLTPVKTVKNTFTSYEELFFIDTW